jgi:hypothetical protein
MSVTLSQTGIVFPDGSSQTVGATSTATASTVVLRDASAAIYAAAFYYSSDENLKDNIVDYVPTITIESLTPREFTWKETGSSDIGFIAQELESVLPQSVSTSSDGMKSISLTPIVALLVLEVKKLKEEIVSLRNKE